jgi:hypothetical protein
MQKLGEKEKSPLIKCFLESSERKERGFLLRKSSSLTCMRLSSDRTHESNLIEARTQNKNGTNARLKDTFCDENGNTNQKQPHKQDDAESSTE